MGRGEGAVEEEAAVMMTSSVRKASAVKQSSAGCPVITLHVGAPDDYHDP